MAIRYEQSGNLLPATLPRRLAAMLYDSLLCVALLMVVAGVYTGIHQFLIHYGILGYDHYTRMLEADGTIHHKPVLSILLILSLWGFFGYFWRLRGQTLGMQAWKIRVQNHDGTPLSWLQALIRVLTGLVSWLALGTGYFWQIIDRDHRAWTDLSSHSVTVFAGTPEQHSRH